MNPNGSKMTHWFTGDKTIQEGTEYIIINFLSDASTIKAEGGAGVCADFTDAQIKLLPTCLELIPSGESGGDNEGENEGGNEDPNPGDTEDTVIKDTLTTVDGYALEKVYSPSDMVYQDKVYFTASRVFANSPSANRYRVSSTSHVLAVFGTETLKLKQNIPGVTLKFAVAEFGESGLGSFVNGGQDMSVWVEGSTQALTADTRYVIINFSKADNSNITTDEAVLLNTCLKIVSSTTPGEPDSGEKPDSGITLSILGDSISTYPGYSNSADGNSNVADNKPSSGIPQYNAVTDTWWHQAITELGIGLLVNNSESGEKVTVKGIEKSSQLHDNTGTNAGEEPDVVVIYMGTNDFRDGVAVGTFKSTYETMIQTIQSNYVDTDLFLFTIPYNTMRNDVALLESYNEAIKDLAATYGCTVVDLYEDSGINASNMSTYYYDVCHPRPIGMDIITNLFVEAYNAKYGN